MTRFSPSAVLAAAGFLAIGPAHAQDCVVTPVNFNSHITETVGEITVKAGKGCGMTIGGITGAINQTVITQMPKFGRAGVRGSTAI